MSRIGACFGRQLLGRRGRFTKAGTYESRFYSTGRTSPRYLWCAFEHDVKRRGGIRFDLQFRPAEPPKAGRLCHHLICTRWQLNLEGAFPVYDNFLCDALIFKGYRQERRTLAYCESTTTPFSVAFAGGVGGVC